MMSVERQTEIAHGVAIAGQTARREHGGNRRSGAFDYVLSADGDALLQRISGDQVDSALVIQVALEVNDRCRADVDDFGLPTRHGKL